MVVNDELQVPPAVPVALPSEVVAPVHTTRVPVIVPPTGNGLTVITRVATERTPQLFMILKDIVAVPAATPVTIPVAPTEAIPGAEELHVPIPARSVSAVVDPLHTVAVPLMVPALVSAFTVTILVAAVRIPQLFTTA